MAKPVTPFDELERLFEQMQENVREMARGLDEDPLEMAPGTSSVDVDLRDLDEQFVLTAELPGFEKADIDVRVSDRTLRLEAEHREASEEEAPGEFVRRERRRASVARSIPLPGDVETDGIEATYNNGVLTVRLPKSEPVTDGTEIEVE